MKKVLIVVDMQNDFITGALGSADAEAAIPEVRRRIDAARAEGGLVIFTRDTHHECYMETLEGRLLPVPHCILGTPGWEIADALKPESGDIVIDKPTFGSTELAERLHGVVGEDTVIELCGVCTDICVASNALIIRAHFPNNRMEIYAAACAGVTRDKHASALETMRSCQIEVLE